MEHRWCGDRRRTHAMLRGGRSVRRENVMRALILIIVLAGSAYEVFYGPSRDLNLAAAIILAIALFSVRKHYRVSYGAIEIAFGLFVLAHNWRQGRGAFS